MIIHFVRTDKFTKRNSTPMTKAWCMDRLVVPTLDVTFESAGEAISNVLNESQKKKYLQPGFRFQIVNTWRPLLPKIEDRPLAVCDPRSINLADIFPADKVYPHWLQEIYYLRYNSSQKWYWLPEQTSSQILLMKMFDSKADASAKFCPHISFDNPGKRASAPPRESIETRSLVITKESGFQHVKGS
ncbi:hypothetical protein EV356DRAFT_393151 [Viridothelium virens]|uniref:Uncharacterized protein n=1 Tax=Viridothelium virens TaxID=1048519 RepID=A0A6A6GUW3_VIRVR|nr:hypothetical protein EV356DRAFT_393151 [Viridothelium virens]